MLASYISLTETRFAYATLVELHLESTLNVYYVALKVINNLVLLL